MQPKILIFNKWDLSEVKVEDLGLKRYINLTPFIVPRTNGKNSSNRSKISIIERFVNKLMVPGHRGKKHKITSGHCSGNSQTIYIAMKKTLENIENKTKKNPVQVMVKAIENAAVLEEVASYRLSGIIARKSVVTSPQRRLDVTLKHLAQGIYKSSFKNKTPLHNVIANEILIAYNNDTKSFAIQEKNRLEKEAEGAR